ncbi:MAG: O-antigen ligase family protein [Micavibrio sp.]
MNPAPSRFAPRFAPGVFAALALTIFLSITLPRSFAFLPGLVGLASLLLWPFFYRNGKPWTWSALSPMLAPVLGLFALSALSAFWAINGPEAFERAVKIFAVLLGGVALYSLCRTLPLKNIFNLWWLLPLITALSALFLIAEYYFDYPAFRLLRDIPPDVHVSLSELNRSTVALSLISLPMLILLYCGVRSKGWSRHQAFGLAGGFVLLLLPVLMMTDSQSAQLAFLLGVLTLIIAPVGRRAFWVVAAIVLCAGVVAAPWIAQYLFSLTPQTPPQVPQNGVGWQYANLINRTNYLPRLELWDYVSRYALNSPWIGYGMDATRYVPAFDSKEIYQPGTTLLHPHNAALQIWMEFGALGATLTAAGLAFLCKKLSALPDQLSKRLGLAVFVGIIGVGVVGYGLWQAWWIGLLAFLASLSVLTIRMVAAQKDAA